jgi:hypothetical protein
MNVDLKQSMGSSPHPIKFPSRNLSMVGINLRDGELEMH